MFTQEPLEAPSGRYTYFSRVLEGKMYQAGPCRVSRGSALPRRAPLGPSLPIEPGGYTHGPHIFPDTNALRCFLSPSLVPYVQKKHVQVTFLAVRARVFQASPRS